MSKTVWKSECGRYLCRITRGGGCFEAWTFDGQIHWQDDDRPGIEACQLFSLPYAVGGFSAELAGQKKGSFTLAMMHCDQTKLIVPFTGNTVISSLDVVFRRKVPPQNRPKWLKNLDIATCDQCLSAPVWDNGLCRACAAAWVVGK